MRLRLTEGLLQELMQQRHATAHAQAAVPAGLSNSFYEPNLGRMFQQYQQHGHFTLAVVQMQLEKEVELITESITPGVNMNFILSGSIFSRFSQLPHDINLTQAEHNLLYINNTSGYHLFRKGQPLQNLHISLSEEYFKELCPPTCTASERMHTCMLKQQPALASPKHGTITLQMQQAIQSILTAEFKGAMQKLYMEAKVLELLALQLNQFELEQDGQQGTANADKTLAEEVRLYLHLHYTDLPSIKELAKIFGTNEFRLKKAFREHVGKGIFGYGQQLRLQHAQELLREGGKTISEVAELIGYSHPNHFSNAFKKQFGYAPSAIKRF